MLFADIKGLDNVKKQLINSVSSDHVAHAQLFMGKPGSPNLPMALAFANYLNCEKPSENDACGECPSCYKNQRFIHPDMHFVYPVSATKNITGKDVVSSSYLKEWRAFLSSTPYGGIDNWSAHYGGEDKQVNISKEESRQIIKNLSLKAFEGKYKVMIIWLPEYMNAAAANGILKILEEPPEKTIFLLVSNDTERLLTTILSRTQIVTIPKFSDESIQQMLEENHGLEPQQANQLSHLADGDYNLAVKLLNNIEDDSHQLFTDWMRDCFRKDFSELVVKSDQFHSMNKVAQRSLFLYALNMFREAIIYNAAPDLKRVSGAVGSFIENFSKVMDSTKVESISKLINDAHYHLERNASPKIIFLDLSLQIARIIK
ncbi:DNA polymerase III subunit [Fulvivirga sediminis]|uniref:DNA polymerase III subunit delta n=1 Tax=Fulvivirga sediminis TaxID=2803949 RepID=A0A937K0Y4_9BACT|nr:DNA polymerase III subunit delta [Fulvivirga sediminis]MBL3656770.1 DNA polymerase III subunit delta [Fulvivirga sediminis]